MEELRIGTLGAARITPAALIRPARRVGGVRVAAVAARDPARASSFAARHGIGRVHRSYEELIADPEIDAVYNPLPNSLHARFTIDALDAGKHVLCEKPFTSNASEAREVAAVAGRSGKVVMEAFHYRYHPLMAKVLDVVAGGELGTLRHVEAKVCFPLLAPRDIRYRHDLAGGATMDAGCYAVHIVRSLAGAEPEVVSARARLWSPGVDRAMTAELRFAGGCSGRVVCSLLSARVLGVSARAVGSSGDMKVMNPLGPQIWNRLSVRAGGATRSERVRGEATYAYQLRAFVAAVRDGQAVLTPPADSVANMSVIDRIYEAAGMAPRGV